MLWNDLAQLKFKFLFSNIWLDYTNSQDCLTCTCLGRGRWRVKGEV